MSGLPFTGERLYDGDPLFDVDLAQHRAAYRFAIERAESARVLDLGCGSGYGTAEIAEAAPFVVGLDRVAPEPASRRNACFVRGDLNALPLMQASFDLVVSFQVIEHLDDPSFYLQAITRVLRENGTALLTTPNRRTSLGVNPFHVREYLGEELAGLLRGYFTDVEMWGISASPAVERYQDGRRKSIQRILRLDPLQLRRHLPRRWIEFLFGRFAILVRSGIRKKEGFPEVTWRDFPIGPSVEDCLDLLAVCRGPR